MVTIRQLAQLSGYSRQTVMRALHNTGYIRSSTKQQILELAALYQYTRPMGGVERDTLDRRSIAVMVSRMGNPFNTALLSGIADYVFAQGFHLTILESHHRLLHVQRAIFTLEEMGIKGLIALTGHSDAQPIPKGTIRDLWSHGIYFVAVDASTPTEIPTDRVETDERQLAATAIDYLMALGHRHIAYVGPPMAVSRTHAVSTILKERGLSRGWFIDGGPWFGGHDEQALETAVRHMLRDANRPTAVFCFDDAYAAFVQLLAHRLHIPIPEQLSVLGCANFSMSQCLVPPLTTIDQQPEEIGRQSVACILRRVTGEQEAGVLVPQMVTIPVRLIKRQSCARPYRS